MQHKKHQSDSEPCKPGLFSKRRHKFGAAAQNALDAVADGSIVNHHHGSLYRSGLALSDLQPGECGYIFHLNGSSRDRLRLLEMGLTPGTHVKVVRAAAFGGPLDILVRGYQLSLRRDEASAVWLDDPDKQE